MLPVYTLHQGNSPLLISIPHAGTEVPRELMSRFSRAAQSLPDTDWHVDKLYAHAIDLDASILIANYSRYVVDLNRASDSSPLYDNAVTTPVCPLATFAGEPIYDDGGPGEDEIHRRIAEYWRPYHLAIQRELARIKGRFDHALLWDAHSIASEVPTLFSGVLPEFNFGTRDAASCPPAVAENLRQYLERDCRYGAVVDGRFKGGYITQRYGAPANGQLAIQLELAQRVYLDEQRPSLWNVRRAATAAELVGKLLDEYVRASREAR